MVHIHCGAYRQREGAVQETGALVGVVGLTSQSEARLGLLPVDDPHLEAQPEGFETPPGLREESERVGVSVLVGDRDGQIQHRQGVIIDSSLAAVELSKRTTIAVLGVREPVLLSESIRKIQPHDAGERPRSFTFVQQF